MHGSRKDKDEDDLEFLRDLLLETSLSISDIAKELGWSVATVNKKINNLGLTWLKNSRKKMSRGQTALTLAMQKLLPGEKVINEFHIGDKLKLDVYCQKYAIAAEYHGRQHFYYTSRFFDSKYDFEEAIKRDQKKAQWCKDNGIALIVFRYNDSLTEQAVFDRLLEAIRTSPYKPKEKNKNDFTSSEIYRSIKKKNSDYKKKLYRSIKEKRDDDRNK
jgi:hypothetical protein